MTTRRKATGQNGGFCFYPAPLTQDRNHTICRNAPGATTAKADSDFSADRGRLFAYGDSKQMYREDDEQPQSFASGEMSDTALVLWERNERAKKQFQTRYVYLPFVDGSAASSIGYAPAGSIFPIEAPRGKMNARLVPEGAQMLMVVSPSTGIPARLAQSAGVADAGNPATAALLRRIDDLEKKLTEGQQEPKSIAVYLIETAPIVDTLLQYYGPEGGVEITSLAGMDAADFGRHKINDLLFGPEGERPTTAGAVREQMNKVLTRTSGSTSAAGRILNGCANEILASVDTCERYCVESMRVRHLNIDDEHNSDPKRYSRRDLRALEFAGLARREDQKQMTIDLQEQSMRALPVMFGMLQAQNERWEKLFDRLIDKLDNTATPKNKRGDQQ
jgi:hypothetical protein